MTNRYDGLADASVIVTGAARGLGQAIVLSFALQGSCITLVDQDAAALEVLRSDLGLAGNRLHTVSTNLSDVQTLGSVVDEAVKTFGHLDVLVNNAAILDGVDFDELEPGRFDEVIATNLRAPLFLSKAAISTMRPRHSGSIVNVASAAARSGGAYPSVVTYAASKAALLSITRSLARLAANDNIRINAILPANIDTPMLRQSFDKADVQSVLATVPLGRTAAPQEVAELVLFLASSASSYVTGASWDINGGWFMT